MSDDHWRIPPLMIDLGTAVAQLRGLSRGGLEEEREADGEEVKGLKFISGKLARLFDRNRRLKYNHISRVLIDNFSSQSNDSRNIKRRVYDAINVMVAAGLFRKSGDCLEKKEEEGFREKVELIRQQLDDRFSQRHSALAAKKKLLATLEKRRKKLGELIERNKGSASKESKERITNPLFVKLGEGTESVKIGNAEQVLCRVDLKKSGKKKVKGARKTEVLQEHEYLQHL